MADENAQKKRAAEPLEDVFPEDYEPLSEDNDSFPDDPFPEASDPDL